MWRLLAPSCRFQASSRARGQLGDENCKLIGGKSSKLVLKVQDMHYVNARNLTCHPAEHVTPLRYHEGPSCLPELTTVTLKVRGLRLHPDAKSVAYLSVARTH